MDLNDGQPLQRVFPASRPNCCRSKGVELLDLSDTVPDDDFYDDTHLSYSGADADRSDDLEFVGVCRGDTQLRGRFGLNVLRITNSPLWK